MHVRDRRAGGILSIAFAGTAMAGSSVNVTLAGPPVKWLPSALALFSTSPNLRIEGCHSSERVARAVLEPCDPYFVRSEGPDGSGFYRHVYRLPMALPGEIHLEAAAWSDDPAAADYRELTFMAAGNRYDIGDVRSCFQPTVLAGGTGTRPYRLYRLAYYAAKDTIITLRRQRRAARKGKRRWVTQKVEQAYQPAGTPEYHAYYRHYAAMPVPGNQVDPRGGPLRPSSPKFRVTYVIRWAGSEVAFRGVLSRRLCARPNGKERGPRSAVT